MRKAPPGRPATYEDLAGLPEQAHFEIIAGQLVEEASPGGEHGTTQLALGATLFGPFSRRPGGPLPGGWWFGSDVDIEFERHEVYRPDVAGWRREHVPERPAGIPVRVRLDWVCEVLSPSNARVDQVTKFETYRRCGVPHYWIADPMLRTLRVFRWTPDGYLVVLNAEAGQRVRAEPFDAIELQVGVLFGDDPEEE
jgi:Uma2 family endonuclease